MVIFRTPVKGVSRNCRSISRINPRFCSVSPAGSWANDEREIDEPGESITPCISGRKSRGSPTKTANAETGSKSCSAGSRIGVGSQHAMTDAGKSSFPPSPWLQLSCSGYEPTTSPDAGKAENWSKIPDPLSDVCRRRYLPQKPSGGPFTNIGAHTLLEAFCDPRTDGIEDEHEDDGNVGDELSGIADQPDGWCRRSRPDRPACPGPVASQPSYQMS